MDLLQLLRVVRRRPGMFVEHGSLTALDAFLRGYHFARIDAGMAGAADDRFVVGFLPWLQRQFAGLPAAATWVAPVEALAARDGREPLALFFELVDRFAAEAGETG